MIGERHELKIPKGKEKSSCDKLTLIPFTGAFKGQKFILWKKSFLYSCLIENFLTFTENWFTPIGISTQQFCHHKNFHFPMIICLSGAPCRTNLISKREPWKLLWKLNFHLIISYVTFHTIHMHTFVWKGKNI